MLVALSFCTLLLLSSIEGRRPRYSEEDEDSTSLGDSSSEETYHKMKGSVQKGLHFTCLNTHCVLIGRRLKCNGKTCPRSDRSNEYKCGMPNRMTVRADVSAMRATCSETGRHIIDAPRLPCPSGQAFDGTKCREKWDKD